MTLVSFPSKAELVTKGQRNLVPALPFCNVRLTSRLRKPGYPSVLNNLGDHLKKRRLDLGLNQKKAAKLLGCHATSVANWTRGTSAPRLAQWRRLIEFLGYDPRPEPTELSGRLLAFRTRLGMSQECMAERLGVEPGTLGRWERGARAPEGKFLARVFGLIGGDPRPMPRTTGERLKRP